MRRHPHPTGAQAHVAPAQCNHLAWTQAHVAGQDEQQQLAFAAGVVA
jgi:hypothetical protein